MRKLVLLFCSSAAAASAAEVYTFGLLPPEGTVQGAPGTTLGWGYALQNQSSSLWLVPTSLNAGTFTNGAPTLLFDFPVLATDTTAMKNFDPASSSGLYQLTWNTSAPVGFTNAGTFTLDAQWWSGPHGGWGICFRCAQCQCRLHRHSDGNCRSGAGYSRAHHGYGFGSAGSHGPSSSLSPARILPAHLSLNDEYRGLALIRGICSRHSSNR